MSTTPNPPSNQPAGNPTPPVARMVSAPAKPAAPAPAAPEDSGGDDLEATAGKRFLLFNALPSCAISALTHFVMIVVMAFMTVAQPEKSGVTSVVSTPTEKTEEVEDFKEEMLKMDVDNTLVSTNQSSEMSAQIESDVMEIPESPSMFNDSDSAQLTVELSDVGATTAPKNDLMSTVGTVTGTGTAGRGEASKGKMVAKYGGNDASEAAVARALQWLAMHQSADGGWNFDHRGGQCAGKCANAGKLVDCRTGATAMALLPFLGAGQTHKTGKYKEVVNRGLYFLGSQMKVKGNAGDLAQGGGNMYSHGLASIVLCEAYAMTHDKALMAPAQLSLNHIVQAQDPVGGGWRYVPRQPGDTSAVGWQLMALKSGHMAYLAVPGNTIVGATKFLDSVQSESGSKYGYTDPGGAPATTAVGLLCRMYLGWKHDNPALQKGVEFMSNMGPSSNNMYYNYYATQVMRQYEGEMWDKWNKVMRDQLVNTQDKAGHQTGSWYQGAGDHGADAGGRLYCTSMSTMILEVYYRHMPIYGKAAAEEDFPLN